MRKQCKVYRIWRLLKDLFSRWWKVEQQKSSLPLWLVLWSRGSLSSVFWNQQGCKCKQTQNLATNIWLCPQEFQLLDLRQQQHRKAIQYQPPLSSCQPKPRTWFARKPCRVVHEQGLGSEGAAGCLVVPDSSAAASSGITEWLRMEGTSGGSRQS